MIPPRLDRERSKIVPDYPMASKRLGEKEGSGQRAHSAEWLCQRVQVLKSSGFLPRQRGGGASDATGDSSRRLDGEAVAAWGSFGVTFRIMQ
jgi:hypothetical protein